MPCTYASPARTLVTVCHSCFLCAILVPHQHSSVVSIHSVFHDRWMLMWQMLSPKQEALLDTKCYPWWPDLWRMADLATAQLSQDPAAAHQSPDEGAAGLPQLCAFEMLRTPMLAIGEGLQMKRTAPPAAEELPWCCSACRFQTWAVDVLMEVKRCSKGPSADDH